MEVAHYAPARACILILNLALLQCGTVQHVRCTLLDVFCLCRCRLHDYEALGVANVVHNLTMFFPMSNFLKLPADILQLFLTHATELTCGVGRAAALEEAVSMSILRECMSSVIPLDRPVACPVACPVYRPSLLRSS